MFRHLLVLLSLVVLTGCGGIYYNDRHADWCTPPELDVATGAAIQEWNSTGQVWMTHHVDEGCVSETYRLRVGDLAPPTIGQTQFSERLITVDPINLVDPEMTRRVVLHELGHWLLGSEHSADPDDVMYPSPTDTNQHLTQADTDRL